MRRRLLEVLVDPGTGEPLKLETGGDDDPIVEGVLVSGSGARYPIVDGVPRFTSTQDYSGSFGLQWNRFARVQLDSATGASYSRNRFDRETGWDDDDLSGGWVVDAGCGSGRFTEIAASYGAEVLAVDLSSAVDAAHANLGHLPNVHLVQADIRALPFRPEAVSHLYSLGVLQHTPDPLLTARALVEYLRPGARFAFTIYARRRWTRLYSKYWVRPLTRRIPSAKLLAGIERVMPAAFPLTSALFSVPRLGRLFQFVIPIANYVERRDLPRQVRYDEAILDTFDMLSPAYDSPVTAAEVEAALRDLTESLEFATTVPVVVRGVRAG
jgi:SAM-dependent methyltransferase